MISRYEAVLNGQALGDISADILVLDIQYSAPAIKNEVYSVAKRQGVRIYRRYVEKISCVISFEIHTYDTVERQKICNAVQQWAGRGGVLQTNDREGQRLRCVCDTFPVIPSAQKWTEPLSVTFSAYSLPFWEEVVPSVLSLSGTSGSGSLWLPGCMDGVPVEVDITAGGALTTLNLTANGRTLTLSGISVSSGQTIKIAYDDEMIQSIKVGSTSLLNKRSGADDLLADCGVSNSFSFSSNASVTVDFKVRGLWV